MTDGYPRKENKSKLIERNGLIKRVTDELKNRILSGEFPVGELLPSQDLLSQKLGVSRATLREALNTLSLMGLVEMRQGVGTFVTAAAPEHFMQLIASLMILDRSSTRELIQAKNMVEPPVAALAAVHAEKQDLVQMEEALLVIETEFDRNEFVDSYTSKDARFHSLIARSSKNRVMYRVVEAIRGLLPAKLVMAFANSPDLLVEAIKYHREIFRAIERHDPDSAERLMKEHVETLTPIASDYFKAQENDQASGE
ncbi:MAG: FadR family transcriptional regulator [bacterium]|nr:FadR family transcriptional regulator [bacterium]